jgi:type I restriction enzyme S subunit
MTGRDARFGDLLLSPLRSGVTIPKDQRGSGIKMINMGEIFRYPRLPDVEMALVDFDYSNAARFLVEPGDLLFARRSLTAEGAGKCAIVLDAPTPRTWESSIIRARMNRAVTDPHYYFYMFQSPLGRKLIGGIVEQVAVAGVRSSDLSNLRVPCPELSEQHAISTALRALDDKITVNDRIARTTFELAATEHARVAQQAERACTLRDVIELAYGKALPATQRRPGPVAVYGSGGISGWHDQHLVRGPGIIVGRKGTVGSVYWSHRDFFPIDTTYYIRVTDDRLTIEYVYFLLSRLGLSAMNSDSAVPGLNRSRALAIPVHLPNAEAITKFTERVRPLFALREQAARENHTLAQLRDTLLPQLMSGRLRVKDAEKVVKEAV